MRVRVLVRSYINEAIHDPGDIIEVDKLDGRVAPVDPPVEEKKAKGKKPPADAAFE